jgi:hypothetical protein
MGGRVFRGKSALSVHHYGASDRHGPRRDDGNPSRIPAAIPLTSPSDQRLERAGPKLSPV